ncbi:MAG: NosD domain-containing protein [Pseudomonadota bacterium]
MKRVFDRSPTRMLPKALFGATVAAAALVCSDMAAAQSLGGFPIREPGSRNTGTGQPGAAQPNQFAEVVVSQGPESKVRTIAAAMRLVKPGGTILVQGGTYTENVVVTKPVAILGMQDAYGRSAVLRPASADPCVSIAPTSPVASVSISKMIFEFDQSRPSAPCIDIHGGTVSVRDSFIIPQDSTIPIRAAFGLRGGPYGSLRPDIIGTIKNPARDRSPEAQKRKLVEEYVVRHGKSFGAENAAWERRASGTRVEEMIHARNVVGQGLAKGPAAGVRVTAGDTRLDGNVIVGARKAVAFESNDNAFLQGVVSNNILIGNGMGINAAGFDADLTLTRNTIRYNSGDGVRADVFTGMKILANEIAGNETGIFMTEKVQSATINSNFVALNYGDAMTVSTGFFGAVAANTFVGNQGCTIDFYSAEQKFLNDATIKVQAYSNFDPVVLFEANNIAEHNPGDIKLSKRQRRKLEKANVNVNLPVCDGKL